MKVKSIVKKKIHFPLGQKIEIFLPSWSTKPFTVHTDDVPWSTGVAILGPLVDVIHIVDPKLSRLHLFPAWREPFPLQRVAPVSSVSVVVDVVLPATDGPVNGPAGRKREVLSR